MKETTISTKRYIELLEHENELNKLNKEEILDYYILQGYRVELNDISDIWINSISHSGTHSPKSLKIKKDTGYIFKVDFSTEEECTKCFEEICYARFKHSKYKRIKR